MKTIMNRAFALIMALALCAGLFTVPALAEDEMSETTTESISEAAGQAAESENDKSKTETSQETETQESEPQETETQESGNEASQESETEKSETEDAAETEKSETEESRESESEAAKTEETEAETERRNSDDSDETESSAPNAGSFIVSGDFRYDAENSVLYLTGDATVSTSEETHANIVIENNATVTLNGVDLVADQGPGILVQSPFDVTLLVEGENSVTGGNGTWINHMAGKFAGIEVEFEYESGETPANRMASLTIDGTGTLNVTGGTNAAGIGGSNGGSRGKGLYGNITINGGTINATAPGSGAGIGSSDNPGDGTSSGSYKKTGCNTWGVITINGGDITAVSTGSGAGIGGGNHVDNCKVIINGGTVDAKGAAGIGCGIGSSKNKGNGGDKGPGYYAADVTINGGDITASSNGIGAAIGGGMYCDAVVVITDGAIHATGGSREGKSHHGGAGIGGGYLGHADVTISGGSIYAIGGDGASGIGSGGSPNATEGRGINGRTNDVTTVPFTNVEISGGDVTAIGGECGGAGIGLGVGGDKVSVTITGGDVKAHGAKSSDTDLRGGAGIGSGFQGAGSGSAKYFTDANVDVAITGGTVLAVGGWAASGIGSGADNKMADTISIDADKASVEAYADGIKFAIDTRILDDEGLTTSRTEGRSYTGDLLQGTFVHAGQIGDYEQNPEGLQSIIVANDNDSLGISKELTAMPKRYRSFATDVPAPGSYTVYTDEESIGKGEGRYFSVCPRDVYNESEVTAKGVRYQVVTGKLCDNFYLFPVKSVVVKKIVKTEGVALQASDINMTVHFALWVNAENKYEEKNGQIWMEDIEIVNGVPQNKAYFVDVPDKTFGVWEVNDDAEGSSPMGQTFGSILLKKVETSRDANEQFDATSNKALIDEDHWSDNVAVINTYVSVDEPAEEPAEEPAQEPTEEPAQEPAPAPHRNDRDRNPQTAPEAPAEIEDEDVPMADIPSLDTPVEIEDETVPMADIPSQDLPVSIDDENAPLAELPPSLANTVTIEDQPAPQANRTSTSTSRSQTRSASVNTPRTGDATHTALWAVMGVVSAAGMVVVSKRRVEA